MESAFEEPMPSDIFEKLNSCDPELAWSLCRNDVGHQLLGEDSVTVPFLDEAYHYIPFGVIAKKKKDKRSGGYSLLPAKSTYGLIGTMSTLTPIGTDKTVFQQQPRPVADHPLNTSYIYKVVGQRNGIKKCIKVKIDGARCFDVCLSMQLGQLVMDTSLEEMRDVKKFYIIYQVFYANHISVNVTIGEQIPGNCFMDTTNRKFVHDRRMPIGFTVQKFPLMQNGTVGFMEKTKLEGLRNGKWRRVSRLPTDPLPQVPQDQAGGSGAPMPVRRHPQDMLPQAPQGAPLPHEDPSRPARADPYLSHDFR